MHRALITTRRTLYHHFPTMPKASKRHAFYAVNRGRRAGVYTTWAECEEQVRGFTGARFKKFPTEQEAQNFAFPRSSTGASSSLTNWNGSPYAVKTLGSTRTPSASILSTVSILPTITPAPQQDHPITTPRRSASPSPTDYYVVHRGRTRGIFLTFDECRAQVEDVVGAEFDRFTDIHEAAHFLKHGYEHVIDVEEDTDVQHAFDNRNERRSIDDVSLDDEEARALAEALALAEAELEKSAAPTFNKPLIIYTDGAAKGNGRDGAIAGIGVFFGDNDPRNIAERLYGERQTNQRAEVMAAIRALEVTTRVDVPIEIHTDSQYLVKAMTSWIHNWIQNGWAKVMNRDLFERLHALVQARGRAGVRFIYVPGHSGHYGNEQADRLANIGCTKSPR